MSEEGSGRGWGLFVGLLALTLLISVGVIIAAVAGSQSRPAKYFRYTVPAGTGARLAQGEKLNLMPAELKMKVGDHLVIVNQDNRLVAVGPYAVQAGETLDQEFRYPGTIIGSCSLQKSGQVKIVVTN